MTSADPGLSAAASPPAGPAADETARLAALHDLRVLDTAPDPRFDRIVRLAALLMRAPRAAIVMIDEHRLWMKARVGFKDGEWPRRSTLVESMLLNGEALFSPDVRADPRFAQAAADSALGTRFYASVPLVAPGDQIVGTLSVGDVEPHPMPTPAEQAALTDLATLVMEELARDAEAAIARERSAVDQERVDLALTAAGLAPYEWDIDGDRLIMSERLRAMVGLEGESMPIDGGAVVMAMVADEDREQAQAVVREALAGSGRFHHEHRMVRPSDGRTIWVASSGVLVRHPDGSPKRLIGVLQDITDRKIAEEQRETLVAELDHRVKNVLAAVQSLAAQSARKASSLDGFLKTFAGRLKSMASAHELLTATRWRGAGMQNIAAAELGGLAPGQTRWEGPDVLLTPRAANALSLALHELATNAVKFGALSNDAGRVEVRWRRSDDGGLNLQWTETGGPPVAPPTRRGFGATLLQKVTGRELGGEAQVDHRRDGVRVVLTAGPNAIAASPAIAEAAEAPLPPTRSGASGGPSRATPPVRIEGMKVLIVEDALLLALELEAGLTESGAVVVGSAGDLEEAKRMCAMDIDAAVLDANLNGESVQPVAAALAARGVPFVFATGYGDDKAMPQNFNAPVIRKPYDVTQVVAALAEVTGRA
ncbi:MAG: HWE histidine kinase domain-containing protein [Caulobacteraceae bacterium]|nr:HWE histidine kinase domain-containing protein [Caulobacteraceae bacterium]